MERPRSVNSAASRRRLEPDQRRLELAERGLELFGNVDYHAISSAGLAKHAGVSRALLHHYFGSKKGYYLASLEVAADEFWRQMTPVRTLREPERTRRGLQQYVRYARANSAGYSALLRSGVAADPAFGDRVESIRRVIVGRVLRSARVPATNVVFTMAVRAWLAQIENLCLSWLSSGIPTEEDLVEMMMRGRDAALRDAASMDPEARADLVEAGVTPR